MICELRALHLASLTHIKANSAANSLLEGERERESRDDEDIRSPFISVDLFAHQDDGMTAS